MFSPSRLHTLESKVERKCASCSILELLRACVVAPSLSPLRSDLASNARPAPTSCAHQSTASSLALSSADGKATAATLPKVEVLARWLALAVSSSHALALSVWPWCSRSALARRPSRSNMCSASATTCQTTPATTPTLARSRRPASRARAPLVPIPAPPPLCTAPKTSTPRCRRDRVRRTSRGGRFDEEGRVGREKRRTRAEERGIEARVCWYVCVADRDGRIRAGLCALVLSRPERRRGWVGDEVEVERSATRTCAGVRRTCRAALEVHSRTSGSSCAAARADVCEDEGEMDCDDDDDDDAPSARPPTTSVASAAGQRRAAHPHRALRPASRPTRTSPRQGPPSRSSSSPRPPPGYPDSERTTTLPSSQSASAHYSPAAHHRPLYRRRRPRAPLRPAAHHLSPRRLNEAGASHASLGRLGARSCAQNKY